MSGEILEVNAPEVLRKYMALAFWIPRAPDRLRKMRKSVLQPEEAEEEAPEAPEEQNIPYLPGKRRRER